MNASLFHLKPVEDCHWDLLSLGEVMLRFDPGEQRIHTARAFNVWEGGGEYNVARGLRRCFGLRTAIATALADNPVGRLVEDLILQGGVDPSLVLWREYDGVGRLVRNGLNFVERGFGPRSPLGCSDRGNTAVSQLRPGDYDWQSIFANRSVRCFHTGGIFTALSESTAQVADEAISAARAHDTLISFDLNYRPSLWKASSDNERARMTYSSLVSKVDILFAGEEDFRDRLDVDLYAVDSSSPEPILRATQKRYPNLQAIAMTQRTAESSTRHRWGAAALVHTHFVMTEMRSIEVLDRIGGGDSFASGFLYGVLSGQSAAWSLECGVAHGTLAMSTPGDSSMATFAEVQHLMHGGTIRTHR